MFANGYATFETLMSKRLKTNSELIDAHEKQEGRDQTDKLIVHKNL